MLRHANLQPERFARLSVFVNRMLTRSTNESIKNARQGRPLSLLELTMIHNSELVLPAKPDRVYAFIVIKSLCEKMEELIRKELYPILAICNWDMDESEQGRYALRVAARDLTPFAYRVIDFLCPSISLPALRKVGRCWRWTRHRKRSA